MARTLVTLASLSCSLALASLAAQEPPLLLTNPPVQTAQFGAAALGSGVTEVGQLQFTPDPSAPVPTWFLSATVHRSGSTFWQPYSGTVTGQPGSYAVTPSNAYSLVPAPTQDYFAANVSADLRVMVTDTGAVTAPAVFVRTNTGAPFVAFGSIGAPVLPTYVDSQIGDTLVPWNGTTGSYEYIFTSGLDIAKTTITLTAPSTVTLGSVATIVSSSIQKHSPSPMRQWTGTPADRGKVRALLYSQNDAIVASSYFRSSPIEVAVYPLAGLRTYADSNWKANPGHIGGATYWAYAGATTYGDPLVEEIVAMSSAFVPASGGTATLCVWTRPTTTPAFCFVVLGVLQSPGLNLGLPFVMGRLGIMPQSMLILPPVPADADQGESTYTFGTPPVPPGTCVDMQAGCLELGGGSGSVALGSAAVLKGG